MKLKSSVLSIYWNILEVLRSIFGLAPLSIGTQQDHQKCMISHIKERYSKSSSIEARNKRKVEQIMDILKFFSLLLVCQVGARVCFQVLKKELRNEIQSKNDEILMSVSILANIIMAISSLSMRIIVKKQNLMKQPGIIFKSASFFIFFAFSSVQILVDGQATQLGLFEVLLNVLIISIAFPESTALHHLFSILICLTLLVSEWIRKKSVEDIAMVALILIASLIVIIKRRRLLSLTCTCSAQIKKKSQELILGEQDGKDDRSLFCKICSKPAFSGIDQTGSLLALVEENNHLNILLNNQTQTGYCIVDSSNQRVLYSNHAMMNKSNTNNLENLFKSIGELEFRFEQVGIDGNGDAFQHEKDSDRFRGQSSNSTFGFSLKNTRISSPSHEKSSSNFSKFPGISVLPVNNKNNQNNSININQGIFQEDQEDNCFKGNSGQDQIQKKNHSFKSTPLSLSPIIKSDQDHFKAGIVTTQTGVLISPTGILDNQTDSPTSIEQDRFVYDSVLSRSQGKDEQDCGKETDPPYLRIINNSAVKNNQAKHQQIKEQPRAIKYGNNPTIRSQKASSQFSSHPSKQENFRQGVRTEIKGMQSNPEQSRLSFFHRISGSSKHRSSIYSGQDYLSSLMGIDFLSSPIFKPKVKYSFSLVENFWEFNKVEVIKSSNGILYLYFEGEEQKKENLEKEMLEELATFQTKIFNSISHEFGTPLNCALNLLKICQNQLPAEFHSSLINPALSSIRVLKFSCSDFIDYSKIQTSQFYLDITETDIRFILSKAVQYFTPLVKQQNQKESISVDVLDDIDVPDTILSDPKRILQIIFNLLTNSLKNTQKGFIKIQVQKENDEEIRISISDSGFGISLEKQLNLFQRTTIKNKLQETGGLGLTIANVIASKLSAHQTGLMVSSQIGVGSTFSFLVSINQQYQVDHQNPNSQNMSSQHSLLFSPQSAQKRGQNKDQLWQQSQPYLPQPKDTVNYSLKKSYSGILEQQHKQESLVNIKIKGSLSRVLHPIQVGATATQKNKDSSSISISSTLSEIEEFSPHQNKETITGVIHQFPSKSFPKVKIQGKSQARSISPIVIQPITLLDQQNDLSFGKTPPLFSESSQFVNTSRQPLKGNTRLENDINSGTNSIFSSPVLTIIEVEKYNEKNQEIPLTNQIHSMLSINEEEFQTPQKYLKPNQLDQLRKYLKTSDSQSPQNCNSSERLTPEVENLNSIKSEKNHNYLAGLERDKKNMISFSHYTDSILASPIQSTKLKRNSEQLISLTFKKQDKRYSCQQDFRINRIEHQTSLERSECFSPTKQQENEYNLQSQQNLSQVSSDSQNISIASEKDREGLTEKKSDIRKYTSLRAKCFSIQDQLFGSSHRINQMQKDEKISRNSKRRRTKSEFGVFDGIAGLKEALKQKPCKCADILIVDDTQMNRHTLKLIISSKFNFIIEEATNGQEAVEKVEATLNPNNHCKTYKMIFMDIDMPVLNGYDATKQINQLLKQHRLFCPIIAYTAFDQSHIQSDMNECGFTDFAGKPVRPQVIESLFTRYIDISTILVEDV